MCHVSSSASMRHINGCPSLMPERSKHVNIDGDVICYAAGFAAQSNEYHVRGDVFECKAEAAVFCKRYEIEQEEIEVRIIPEPIEFCLSTVKRMVKNIVEKSGSETYTVILSGKGNFRIDLATLQPYKGNRVSAKPIHYEAIRTYITAVLNSITVEGEEADDYLSYRMVSHNETCATIDKDLRNTSGWHYNWNHDMVDYVPLRTANQNFWKQMLTGDATDNIAGLYKLTGSKCSAAMKSEIDKCLTYGEMKEAVVDTYSRAFEKLANKMGVEYVESDELARILTETGRLLWMRRCPDEMWSISYVPQEPANRAGLATGESDREGVPDGSL